MTKQQQSERDEFIAKLRETLKPGDTLHTVLRSVSRSGMQRVIDVYPPVRRRQGASPEIVVVLLDCEGLRFAFRQVARRYQDGRLRHGYGL